MIPFAAAFLAARASRRVDPPANLAAPAIAGSAVVGVTLQASTGTWLGDPTGYSYQWLRGGADILGAQGSSYRLTVADIGYVISVRVVASNAGGASSPKTSAATAAVQDGVPVNTALPTISGTVTVGSWLSATLGAWTNSPTSHSHQWRRGGSPISGAQGSTYMVTAADVGYVISVQVVAGNGNGTSQPAVSAATAPASYPAPVIIDMPTISGSAAVGNTLSAWRGNWSGAPTSYTFQWRRSGSPISGAEGSTYTVTADDIGYTISCRVTAYNAGGSDYEDAVAGTVGNPVPSNTDLPTITGVAAVGNVLSAWRGAWSGAPTSYAFQWRRGSSNISGAQGTTYTVTAADIGYTISVRVQAVNAAGSSPYAYANATATVPTPLYPPTNTALPAINGTGAVGNTLTANVGLWTASPTSHRYEWYRAGGVGGGKVVGTSASYTLTSADVGGVIYLTVWARNAAGESGPATAGNSVSLPVAVPTNTSLPTISGTLQVGATLTANPGGWTGSPTEYEYQWVKGGAESTIIATTRTYTLHPGDVHATLQVRVRARNAGGLSSQARSAYTTGVAPLDPPTNTLAPFISGQPKFGGVLTANPGWWTGSPTRYEYQWHEGTQSEAAPSGWNWSIIPGQNASTLTVANHGGLFRRVRVTAFNASGSAEAFSDPVAIQL